MIQLDKIKVLQDSSIREAIKMMDDGGIGFIYIVNYNNEVVGVVSDGDFRRAVLKGISLNDSISLIMNKHFIQLEKDYEIEKVKYIFQKTVAKHLPIVNNKIVIDVVTEESILGFGKKKIDCKIDLPVVIMAGGQGTRLDPFTKILPKPLIPIGDKTILEIIIDKFKDYKIEKFYLSVNHKANIIKSYFEELAPDYLIKYIYEEKPLGTAGSLRQLYNIIEKIFILTNCDIIIEADYNDIIKHHIANNNEITIVVSVKHFKIPYGICEIEEGGMLIGIKEKPAYDFLVNTGMYIINSETLKYIPENEFFHMTNFIEKLKQKKCKIGVYPVSDKSWIDTGEWVEYKKAVDRLT